MRNRLCIQLCEWYCFELILWAILCACQFPLGNLPAEKPPRAWSFTHLHSPTPSTKYSLRRRVCRSGTTNKVPYTRHRPTLNAHATCEAALLAAENHSEPPLPHGRANRSPRCNGSEPGSSPRYQHNGRSTMACQMAQTNTATNYAATTTQMQCLFVV